jgi:hypothetical protein
MFLTSNGVVAMMSSFDKTYDNYHKRNPLMTRLVAVKNIGADSGTVYLLNIICRAGAEFTQLGF